MKTTILILILSISMQLVYSQETARERIEQRSQAETAHNTSELNSFKSNSNFQLNDIIENSRWSRIIYRYINLSNPTNAPLYYPETPIEGRENQIGRALCREGV